MLIPTMARNVLERSFVVTLYKHIGVSLGLKHEVWEAMGIENGRKACTQACSRQQTASDIPKRFGLNQVDSLKSKPFQQVF